MGNCAIFAGHHTTAARNVVVDGGSGGGRRRLNWSNAKIIHYDGKLQEFHRPIKAGHVLSLHPNCFLCSIESINVDCHVPHVPQDEELQLGQIYFLMPQSIHESPLSLHQICSLAIKAAASLGDNNLNNNGEVLQSQQQRLICCRIPIGYSIVSVASLVGKQ